MLSDLAQWAALRAYTTLAVNYRLRGAPLQKAINDAASEARHIGMAFDQLFGAGPTIEAQAEQSAPMNGRDAAGHGAQWPHGVPPGVDPNVSIPKPSENGATS